MSTQPAIGAAKVQPVIVTDGMKGKGVDEDPVRRVIDYWSLDGEHLAQRDTWQVQEGARAVRQSSMSVGETHHTPPCERAPSPSPSRENPVGSFRGQETGSVAKYEARSGPVSVSLPTVERLAEVIDEASGSVMKRENDICVAMAVMGLYGPHIERLEHERDDQKMLASVANKMLDAIRAATKDDTSTNHVTMRVFNLVRDLKEARERIAALEKELGHSTGRENELRNQSIESHRLQGKAERERDDISKARTDALSWIQSTHDVLTRAGAPRDGKDLAERLRLFLESRSTRRAPVKLPRFDERSGQWSLVTEKGSGTYVNGLDAVRQALADAGVEYECPSAPLGRPEDQA